jgi:hypothetical protein
MQVVVGFSLGVEAPEIILVAHLGEIHLHHLQNQESVLLPLSMEEPLETLGAMP